MSRLRLPAKWSGDSTVSIGTAFVLQGTLIVSGIVAARLLGAEARGTLALLMLYPSVLGLIGTLGIPASVTYHVARTPDASSDIVKVLFGPFLLVTFLLVAVHAFIILVLRSHDSEAVRTAGLATLIALPGAALQGFGMAIIQGLQKFLLYNLLRTLQLVAYSGALVGLVLAGENSVTWIAASWAASMALGAAVVFPIALRALPPPKAKAPGQAEMLRFGSRSMLGGTNLVESLRLDQLAVSMVANPAVLGIYVVGAAFSNLPRFVATSLGMLAFPKVASSGQYAVDTAVRLIVVAAVLCGVVVLAIAATLGVIVPYFFGSGFEDSVLVGRVLLISAYLYSLRRVAGECARGLGLPELPSMTELLSLLVLVPAIAVLSRESPLLGVAWALAISATVSLLLLIALVWRSVRRPPSSPFMSVRESGVRIRHQAQ